MAFEIPGGKKPESKKPEKKAAEAIKKAPAVAGSPKKKTRVKDESFKDIKAALLNKLPEITRGADETRRLLDEMQEMQNRVDDLLRQVKEKTGMSLNEVAAFLGNPKNFNPEEWEKIKKRKADFEKSFLGSVKAKTETKAKKGIGSVVEKASATKKVKPPSARRKWLPMS